MSRHSQPVQSQPYCSSSNKHMVRGSSVGCMMAQWLHVLSRQMGHGGGDVGGGGSGGGGDIGGDIACLKPGALSGLSLCQG